MNLTGQYPKNLLDAYTKAIEGIKEVESEERKSAWMNPPIDIVKSGNKECWHINFDAIINRVKNLYSYSDKTENENKELYMLEDTIIDMIGSELDSVIYEYNTVHDYCVTIGVEKYVQVDCFDKDNSTSLHNLFILLPLSSSHFVKYQDKKGMCVNIAHLLEMIGKTPESFWNPSLKKERQQFTYLITNTATGNYKIGKSFNPDNRFDSLSCGVKLTSGRRDKLQLVCIIEGDLENELHRKFKDKRIVSEWFELNRSDVEYIKSFQ